MGQFEHRKFSTRPGKHYLLDPKKVPLVDSDSIYNVCILDKKRNNGTCGEGGL